MRPAPFGPTPRVRCYHNSTETQLKLIRVKGWRSRGASSKTVHRLLNRLRLSEVCEGSRKEGGWGEGIVKAVPGNSIQKLAREGASQRPPLRTKRTYSVYARHGTDES